MCFSLNNQHKLFRTLNFGLQISLIQNLTLPKAITSPLAKLIRNLHPKNRLALTSYDHTARESQSLEKITEGAICAAQAQQVPTETVNRATGTAPIKKTYHEIFSDFSRL